MEREEPKRRRGPAGWRKVGETSWRRATGERVVRVRSPIGALHWRAFMASGDSYLTRGNHRVAWWYTPEGAMDAVDRRILGYDCPECGGRCRRPHLSRCECGRCIAPGNVICYPCSIRTAKNP